MIKMTLLDIFVNIFQTLFISIGINLYCKTKKVLPVFVLFLLLFLEVCFFNIHFEYEGYYSFAYCVTICIIMIIFGKTNIIEYVFIALFTLLSISIGNEFMDLLIMIPLNISFVELVSSSNLVALVGVGSGMIVFIFLLVLYHFRQEYENLFEKNRYILLIICIISNIITIIMESILFSINDKNYEINAILCILGIAFLAVIGVFIIFKQNIDNIENTSLKILSKQIATVKDTLSAFEENDKKISTIKHDIKGYLTIINNYLNNDEYDKAKNELKLMIDDLDNISVIPHTGYTAIDCIIAIKMNICQKNNIKFNTSINRYILSSFEEVDIAIILNNSIDNAIENINNSNPYIDLSITNDNDRLKICVINSTKNDVIKYNPKLVTHKNDRDNHGYGLESIKIIAKKYDGNIYTNSNEHEFTLIMILPLKKF